MLTSSVASALLGCAGRRALDPAATAGPIAVGVNLPDTITFQADISPIRALAFQRGAVWFGSERGLRRVRLPGGPAEWIGAEAGLPGGGVSALAGDGDGGGVLVAGDAEVGHLIQSDRRWRYQTRIKLPRVTHLRAATGGGAAGGVWAGTPTGLFLLRAGRADSVALPRSGAVTSLDLDSDGESVWVGLAGQGIFHVDARGVRAGFGPQGQTVAVDFVDCLGTALLPNGTRIAAGRSARGQTRILVLRLAGAELLVSDSALPARALVAPQAAATSATDNPLLLGGTADAPRVYRLELAMRGEPVEAGGVRFGPANKNLQGTRIVAHPDARRIPPEVTIAIAGGADATDAVFVGTASLGVARLASDRPDYLPGGELSLDATGLSVACLQQERCVFATGGGPGWIWDGGHRSVKPIPDDAIGGRLMALAGDGRGTVYFVGSGSGKTLRIARLSSDGSSWDPFMTLPVEVEGAPVVTAATLSPEGNIWMAVRDRASSGQAFGRGVIELILPAGRAIHHRPYRARETRPAEAMPIAGDVAAVRFARGAGAADPQSVWFCTSLGIQRFVGGQLSQWGESDGLDSETCHDLAVGADGTVWAATEKGVVRFDGRSWVRLGAGDRSASATSPPWPWPVDRDGDSVAARAFVLSGETLWAATSRGVWSLDGAGTRFDRAHGLVDDDVRELAQDRFGRVWILGQIGLTVRRPFVR